MDVCSGISGSTYLSNSDVTQQLLDQLMRHIHLLDPSSTSVGNFHRRCHMRLVLHGFQDEGEADTDGEADSQADSFVVADGYLSESERMDLEDIAAAVGGKQHPPDA